MQTFLIYLLLGYALNLFSLFIIAMVYKDDGPNFLLGLTTIVCSSLIPYIGLIGTVYILYGHYFIEPKRQRRNK